MQKLIVSGDYHQWVEMMRGRNEELTSYLLAERAQPRPPSPLPQPHASDLPPAGRASFPGSLLRRPFRHTLRSRSLKSQVRSLEYPQIF